MTARRDIEWKYQVNVVGVEVVEALLEVFLDERRALMAVRALSNFFPMVSVKYTYWSFVVIQISSRGIPDFLMATAVAFSVPSTVLE